MRMQARLNEALSTIESVIYGKRSVIRLSVTCLLSGGHLLLEDLPGMGKTTLAHTLAKVFGLQYRRIQFTSDLLPGDVLGGPVFDTQTGAFQFHEGPVFTQLLLADEINRSTAKTQSALLEAMEEKQVSMDGQTRPLPEPFFVIATQNPLSQYGTYPLPESQLDRFLMRLSMGYPDPETERKLLLHGDTRVDIDALPNIFDDAALLEAHKAVKQITVSEELVAYVQRLAEATRDHEGILLGLSPRGALGLLEASKAWAYLEGASYVTPDHVQAVFEAVVAHRLMVRDAHTESSQLWAKRLLACVDVFQ
jgi:MoxR-like ATPase